MKKEDYYIELYYKQDHQKRWTEVIYFKLCNFESYAEAYKLLDDEYKFNKELKRSNLSAFTKCKALPFHSSNQIPDKYILDKTVLFPESEKSNNKKIEVNSENMITYAKKINLSIDVIGKFKQPNKIKTCKVLKVALDEYIQGIYFTESYRAINTIIYAFMDYVLDEEIVDDIVDIKDILQKTNKEFKDDTILNDDSLTIKSLSLPINKKEFVKFNCTIPFKVNDECIDYLQSLVDGYVDMRYIKIRENMLDFIKR